MLSSLVQAFKKEKFFSFLSNFISLTLVGIISLLLIRGIEYSFVKEAFGLGFSDVFFELKGFGLDILHLLVFFAITFIPFLLLHLFIPKIAYGILKTILLLLLLIKLLLVQYFIFTSVPLDHVIFTYSFDEILHIIHSSNNTNLTSILTSLMLILLFFTGLKVFSRIKIKPIFNFLFIGIVLSSVFFIPFALPKANAYKEDMEYFMVTNKLVYLGGHAYNFWNTDEEVLDNEYIRSVVRDYHAYNSEFDFINNRYPFLHQDNSKDVIGDYFSFNETPPNFVFIIVESLSRAFCGENAYMGSFTPYLDSLMDESLYWENFLSTSERTFGVIPSVFGALPYADQGFMRLSSSMPDHNSLISLLKKNGYHTSFFHGGWTHFDNIDDFMHRQNVDYILEDFGDNYAKMDTTDDGFSWGYADKDVFKRSFEVIDSTAQSQRLDIYLTLTSHSPWLYPNKKRYEALFEKRVRELGCLEKYKSQLSCFMYVDEAIRYLIEGYKSRGLYENTIFIITGDHRMGTPPKSRIDKYHVPFIIHSPLLKKAEKFSSVSSHRNITPAILALLKGNFEMNLPSRSHWTALPIDTARKFRNVHSLPFMLNNKSIVEYLDGNYFIKNDQLYQLGESMSLEIIDNDSILKQLQKKLEDYKILNRYVCENNMLLFNASHLKRKKQILEQYATGFELDEEISEEFMDIVTTEYSFSGNCATKIGCDDEFSPCFQKLKVDDYYNEVLIDINFKFKAESSEIKNPLYLVIALQEECPDGKKMTMWEGKELVKASFTEMTDWEDVSLTKRVNLKHYNVQNDCQLSIYIWNRKQCNCYVDDLSIKTIGEYEN